MGYSVRKRIAFIALATLVSSPALSANTLPLTVGLYVQADTPCHQASNATTMAYWGGGAGIAFAKITCKLTKMKQLDKSNYILTQRCMDIQSGSTLEESGYDRDFKIVIKDAKSINLDTVAYRYCSALVGTAK